MNIPVPVIVSDWKRIITYPGKHLNDFTLFRDKKGAWHCIGILGTGTWESERSLFHCSAGSLLAGYTIHKPILVKNQLIKASKNTAAQKHAPFVIEKDDTYYMFYRRPPGSIICTTSSDAFKWVNPGFLVFERKDARDICIIRHSGIYHMYYCQSEKVDNIDRSCILLRYSKDLIKWTEPDIVFVDEQKPAAHSYLESPYVIKRKEGFYLFIRHQLYYRDCETVVLFSKKADRFTKINGSWLQRFKNVHAPEIVEFNNKYYIARVSGAKHANPRAPKNGYVEVAEMKFAGQTALTSAHPLPLSGPFVSGK